MNSPRYRWQENFISYKGIMDRCFIYCDTNASFVSVHQYLEGGVNKPCVVANGNVSGSGDAGSCLAISYEARGRGLTRGSSLLHAKKMIPSLVVYESCLPLYDIYAELYDQILEWIVPRELFYRGSCDEVVISYDRRRMPVYKDFRSMIAAVVPMLSAKCEVDIYFHLEQDKLEAIDLLPPSIQVILGLSYLLRETFFQILGLPISIGIAPSICLAKALIDVAKPQWVSGHRLYKTAHDAIAFPQNRDDANHFLRSRSLKDFCGVNTVATRFIDQGYKTAGQVQDNCGLDDAIRVAKNKHLGEVLWYSVHGRDDVLPGYLSAIRDRK